MLFTVVDRRSAISPLDYPAAYLIRDNWNDWFKFQTLFSLILFDEAGNQCDLDDVKIGQFGMEEDQLRPRIPSEFDRLDGSFFSLGQSDAYYETLNQLGHPLKTQVLTGLNDVVADLSLFDRALEEEVTRNSLLRFVSPVTVRGQFRRLVEGRAKLSHYSFSYMAPVYRGNKRSSVSLTFEVVPESAPPTNIHVLIGRNGVGKTHILNQMARSLINKEASVRQVGKFSSGGDTESTELFANLISVTFSAFDDFDPLREKRDKTINLKYSYIGLKRLTNKEDATEPIKSPYMLATEFVNSIYACRKGPRGELWRRSIQMLESDPISKRLQSYH